MVKMDLECLWVPVVKSWMGGTRVESLMSFLSTGCHQGILPYSSPLTQVFASLNLLPIYLIPYAL